jgi:hypothetical protein
VAVGNASFQQVIISFERWQCFAGTLRLNQEILTQDKSLKAAAVLGLLKSSTSSLKHSAKAWYIPAVFSSN